MLRKESRDYRGIIILHPHLSVLDIVLDNIQNFFGIGDSRNLEFHVLELDCEEDGAAPNCSRCRQVLGCSGIGPPKAQDVGVRALT